VPNRTGSLRARIRERLTPSNRRRGRALFSYLPEPVEWRGDDVRLGGHSNKWESREIARILHDLGYTVEPISWLDRAFEPTQGYDVLFDIDQNLQRLAPLVGNGATKLLHLTGSYGPHQNAAERARIEALQARRNVSYNPQRSIDKVDLAERSLELADRCSLIGNEQTRSTYPERHRSKISLVTVSASEPVPRKDPSTFVPRSRCFLWFFGSGAVHKGLDLLLEVFAVERDLTLHVVGNIDAEREFFSIYESELSLPNITYHGHLDPSSDEFARVVGESFCFVAPSCSEGISPAVASCMRIGLYPIVSRETGITLPQGKGIYLESCSIAEISSAVREAFNLSERELVEQIGSVQAFADAHYSRAAFSATMHDYLSRSLAEGARDDAKH
jgi:hypothetical protein